MDPDCLAPKQLPHTSRLYTAYLSKPGRLAAYYAHPADLRGIRAAARELKAGPTRYPAEMRGAVAKILLDQNTRFAGGALTLLAKRNLSRFESGAVAIVTGQQVGLFGGPSYTFYKALSVIRVAADVTRSGMEAVPVFWMASEDHDLTEVNHVYCSPSGARSDGVLEKLEWSEDAQTQEQSEGRSVGGVLLGKGIEALVRKAAEALGGAFAAEMSDALTSAYRPKETFSSAFARLMTNLFARRGLILIDPQDARLHQLAAPVMQRAAQLQEELTAALLAQDTKLEKAGYHAQVKVAENSTLLFHTVEGRRVALKRINSAFAAGAEHFSAKELGAAVAASPQLFSPNALLRPVVQDALLPTAAYIGGPAEIAYFAQNSVLYKKLLGRMPAILPRASFTCIEPEVQRLLDRYGLEPVDVLRGSQSLAAKMERRFIHPQLAVRFDVEQNNLERMLRGFRKPLGKLDPTLKGALDTAAGKMLYQLEKLRRKAGRAADFRTGVLAKHEQAVLAALAPQHDLQERCLSLLPFLARHGTDLFDDLGKICGVTPCAHRFVRL
jgi:bacillithiol biosynthesis cysteine-adding enzyme BshC